jgi:hypothetical protein
MINAPNNITSGSEQTIWRDVKTNGVFSLNGNVLLLKADSATVHRTM